MCQDNDVPVFAEGGHPLRHFIDLPVGNFHEVQVIVAAVQAEDDNFLCRVFIDLQFQAIRPILIARILVPAHRGGIVVAAQRNVCFDGHGFGDIKIPCNPTGGVVAEVKVNGGAIHPVAETPGIAVGVGGDVVSHYAGFVVSCHNFYLQCFFQS